MVNYGVIMIGYRNGRIESEHGLNDKKGRDGKLDA
jgi:hypothetical protein